MRNMYAYMLTLKFFNKHEIVELFTITLANLR